MAPLTRREWKILVMLVMIYIIAGFGHSLPGPFYPKEAESKGATATEYGLVIGIYEFVSFVSSLILGKYMGLLGAVFLLRTGIFVAGISTILFGMLHLVNVHDAFIGLSFVVRIVTSLGTTALLTSSYCIVAASFQERLATIFASMEVLYGLGHILGPILGGLLVTLGGYMVPFLTAGVFLLVTGWLIVCILPPLDDGDSTPRLQPRLRSFLRLTPVLLDLFAVVASSIGTGFYSATLEPHLRQFELTTLSTGALFVISAITNSVTAPLVGKLCDKYYVSPRKVIVVGAFTGMLSFALVGPLPFTNLPSVLWLCCLGLAFQGLTNACLQVSAFIDGIRSAVEYGLPDDITTYGMVSGLWASSMALGAFIGSSAAGVLYDNVGFRIGSLFTISTYMLLMLSMITFICTRRRSVPLLVDEKTTYGTLTVPTSQRADELGEKLA